MRAEYICLRCSHEWIEKTRGGPVHDPRGHDYESHGPTQCPGCYHLYVKWTNYD